MKDNNLVWGIVVVLVLALGFLIYGFSGAREISITGGVVSDVRGVIGSKPVICASDYRPICGMDGENHSNFCMMESVGVRLLHEGECGEAVDIIYFGGTIVTVEGDGTEYAEAVSVKNGNVVFVGDLIEAAKRQRVNTDMRDLGRRTMLSGHVVSDNLDVDEMTEEIRNWISREHVRKDVGSMIGLGEGADFIILDLDLVIEERTDLDGFEILEIVKGGVVIYDDYPI